MIKKYHNGAWIEIPYRKYDTETDTLTTLPADLYADGNNATVGLAGNMSQTGTPTPQNPIIPSECGDLETTGAHAGQYKIPILSANTTTPVYLGEVETERKIRKLVLTGEENWTTYESVDCTYRYILPSTGVATLGICSHFTSVTALARLTDGTFLRGGLNYLYIRYDTPEDVTAFKAFLTAQYNNGTPVTVWYVLTTPTTGIVNEPLRKIGDYADTVSGISIPTITGADSFDVLTTLKPYEVTANYHGWHTGTVHERESSQWD